MADISNEALAAVAAIEGAAWELIANAGAADEAEAPTPEPLRQAARGAVFTMLAGSLAAGAK